MHFPRGDPAEWTLLQILESESDEADAAQGRERAMAVVAVAVSVTLLGARKKNIFSAACG